MNRRLDLPSTHPFTIGLVYGTLMRSSVQLRSQGSSLRDYVDSREARTDCRAGALKLCWESSPDDLARPGTYHDCPRISKVASARSKS